MATASHFGENETAGETMPATSARRRAAPYNARANAGSNVGGCVI